MDVESNLKLTLYIDKKFMMNGVWLPGLFSWADLKVFFLIWVKCMLMKQKVIDVAPAKSSFVGPIGLQFYENKNTTEKLNILFIYKC